VFRDPEYVKWANEETIHLLSYSVDLSSEKPEPVVEVERDGEKVEVIAAYPMFTLNDAAYLVNQINAKVKFPTSTPWTGVIAPDGTTVLAETKRGTAKEYRALYEEQQKKYGKPMPRAAWLEANARLSDSSTSEADGEWAKAVGAALAARKAAGDCPKPLADRVKAQLDALDEIGRGRLEKATKVADAAKRAAALAAVAKDFAGLPSGTEAAAAK
jgi:hypothetical protein